ncbi:hypothetical protein [Clostridium sp. ZBS18]|uniref:hypothetical protein n=1 Tax=Clostridium sp. ZBS18 TaxID=2949967 RepID=UPI00207A30BA|nr:hypothetical protein [Clostridium sp. ZBS18]
MVLKKEIIFNNIKWCCTYDNGLVEIRKDSFQNLNVIYRGTLPMYGDGIIDNFSNLILKINKINIELDEYKEFLEWDGNLDKPNVLQTIVNRLDELERKIKNINTTYPTDMNKEDRKELYDLVKTYINLESVKNERIKKNNRYNDIL